MAAVLGLLLATFFAASAWADDRPLLRACFVEWQPYAWTAGSDATAGISVEILRLAAARAGLSALFSEMPWKRCLAEVERGRLDVAMDGAPRPEFVVGKESYVTSHYVFWVRGDDRLRGSSDPVHLNGRRISLIQGWWYPPALHQAGTHLDFIELDSEEGQLRGLALGRQDAAYGEWITMRLKAERLRLDLRPLLPAHVAVQFYPLFHRGRSDLARRVDVALAALREEGVVDTVYRRHVGQSLGELTQAAGLGRPGMPAGPLR
jgi:polar amino acid transport system substrate-binding protein